MRWTHIPQPMQSNLKFHAQTLTRLASILVFALAMAGTAAAQVAPVGPYGFVLNATFSDPSTHGGAAMLGLANFDGAGSVSGPYALELGSGGANPQASLSGTFTGTYVSNPNPDDPNGTTWTVSLALDIGVNLTLTAVIDNQGRGLQLAVTGCSGPICDNNLTGTVVSGVGAAEFNGLVHPVRQRFLNGSYGMQSTKSSPTPQTTLEVWTFYSASGTVSVSGTAVGPGLAMGGDTRWGTYTLNPDGSGTGTMTFQPPPGGQNVQTFVFVIAGGHSGLLALQTNRAGDGVRFLTGQHQ